MYQLGHEYGRSKLQRTREAKEDNHGLTLNVPMGTGGHEVLPALIQRTKKSGGLVLESPATVAYPGVSDTHNSYCKFRNFCENFTLFS